MIDLGECTATECPRCGPRNRAAEIEPPADTAREHVNWIRSLGRD